jgi:hypothetical protein
MSVVYTKSFWMERGIEMEQEAADWYEFKTGANLRKCGFVTNDQRTAGASPDRFVVEGNKIVGAVEIKCPAPWTHIANLLAGKIDSQYTPQTQGQILIAEVCFVDWISYHPEYGGVVYRQERDEGYQEILEDRLAHFQEIKEERLARLLRLGVIDERTAGRGCARESATKTN